MNAPWALFDRGKLARGAGYFCYARRAMPGARDRERPLGLFYYLPNAFAVEKGYGGWLLCATIKM